MAMRGFIITFGAMAVGLIYTAGAAVGSLLTFTIDSELSFASFTLETTDGVQFSSAQTPNSDTTSLSGTADIDVTGGAIQFLTTGDSQFALQALDQAPLPGGNPGTAPAQFGLDVLLPGFASGVAAARDYVGDATSGPIPLVGTSFDSSQVTMNLVVGNTDYNLTVLGNPVSGRIDTNFPALNELTGGTLTFDGGLYTLTLPLRVSGTINISGFTVVNVYSGQIIATALVPEPSTIILAAIGLVGVLAFGWRRKR